MTAHLAVEAATAKPPAGWAIEPFRRLAAERETRNSQLVERSLSLSSTGLLYDRTEETERQFASEQSARNAWVVLPGDLVVNPMWLFGGAIGVSDRRGAVSPDYRVYELSPRLEPRFVHHLLRSSTYRDQYRLYMRAETTFDRRITKDDFNEMPLVVPPLRDQRAIAGYLDAETARIDALVALRRGQVELLEVRFDVVREVWLQELRREYGSLPLKRMARGIEQGWSPECEMTPADPDEWGVLKTSSVSGGSFEATANKRLATAVDPDPRWVVNDGDLLVVRGSGSPGSVAQAAVAVINGRKLLLPDLLYRVRLVGADPWFVAHALRSRFARDQFEAAIRTDVGMTRKIRTEDLATVQIPAVPPSKQGAAADALTASSDRVRSARVAADRQIALLLERRQALMTAAVTGQLAIPVMAA
jgi:type I restriction enzyme S subunit